MGEFVAPEIYDRHSIQIGIVALMNWLPPGNKLIIGIVDILLNS